MLFLLYLERSKKVFLCGLRLSFYSYILYHCVFQLILEYNLLFIASLDKNIFSILLMMMMLYLVLYSVANILVVFLTKTR